MEKSGLWSKQKTADFLFQDVIDNPQRRKEKLNNWINRKIIPKNITGKFGKDVLFFEDELKKWLETRKRTAA